MNTPLAASDTQISELLDLEQPRANPNAGKQAIRYGREILLMADHLIEHWPTENRASERLSELYAVGYFVGVGPRGEQISYRERMHCGPAKRCGEESKRVDCGHFEPAEIVEASYDDPDDCPCCDEVTP